MTCLRCGCARDRHVYSAAAIVHACMDCTCSSYVAVGLTFEAPWGRYQVTKLGEGCVWLKEVGSWSYVSPTLDRIGSDYKEAIETVTPATPTPKPKNERGKKTKAAAATGMADLFAAPVNPAAQPIPLEVVAPPVVEEQHARAQAVPVRSLDLDLHDDRVARAAHGRPLLLTLGAVRPTSDYPGIQTGISLPGRLLQYWMPCARPADGQTHAWFIGDSHEPHIYCDSCREERGTGRPLPEVASVPADRAGTWTLWSWESGPATFAPAAADTVAVSMNTSPGPRPLSGGRPPWDDDPRGAAWTWASLSPKQRAAMREVYEERAAIMEYDGGLVRAEAEYRAYGILMKLAERHGLSAAAWREAGFEDRQ